MTNYAKPISASNPPDSRGNRGAKDKELLAVEGTEIKPKPKEAVHQPTNVEPSPVKKVVTKKMEKKPTS